MFSAYAHNPFLSMYSVWGEPFVDTKVRNDIPARIMLIGAVLVFGYFGDDAAVDERGIGIIIFRVGGIPLAVLEPFLKGL